MLSFSQDKHRFNKHPKFTLTESMANTNKPGKAIQELLKRREKIWITTLETLQPYELNRVIS